MTFKIHSILAELTKIITSNHKNRTQDRNIISLKFTT